MNDEWKRETGTAADPSLIIQHSSISIQRAAGEAPLGNVTLTGPASPGRLGLRARGDCCFYYTAGREDGRGGDGVKG
jgi:hypothetical protein